MADTIQAISCAICGATGQNFFCAKNGYTLYRCTKCGHGMIRPLPADVSRVYEQDYFAGAEGGFGYVDYDRDKEPMHRFFVENLTRVERLLRVSGLPQKGKVLDVGAATGFFLAIARERGWSVCGVELSDFAARIARDKGIDVLAGTLADIDAAPGSFNLITLWDVIEHVQHPLSELQRVVELLAPGGVVLMTTPDWSSTYARLLGKRWHSIVPPEHLHYFTRASMRLALAQVGLEEIEISGPIKSFTLSYIFQMLSRWQGPLLWGRVVSFFKRYPMLGELSIPVPLRDNMLVFARKI